MQNSARPLHSSIPLPTQEHVLPRLPIGHIARPRLTQTLLASDCRLSLICAPAGFGKSVLLGECARLAPAGTQVVWLDLLGHPMTAEDLLGRLAAALQLPHGEGEACNELSQLLGRIEQPLWIVLDDYPRQPCPDLDICLDRLLERGPHTLRWWIGGRRRPAWNLPRLLLQGDLQELDAHGLTLNQAELAQLLEQRHLQLSAEQQTQLLHQTEGWLAGVCLLLLGGNAEQLSERLQAGTPLLQEYVEREVLAGLPAELLQALLTLAHMPRFSEALCRHLLEDQEGDIALEQLRQRQLFLHSLDGSGTWFRLWRPLATLLKRMPVSQSAHHAHVLACQWFAARGEVREAVEHALLAGQPEVATSYLQRYGQDQLLIGQSVSQFLQWRDELPDNLFSSTPRLILLQAWALIICTRLDEVETCLADINRFLPQPNARRQQQVIAHYQAVMGMLHRQCGETEAALNSQQALDYLDEESWSLQIICHQALAQHYCASPDLGLAQRYSNEGLRLSRQRGNVLYEALLGVDHVHLLSMSGEQPRALEHAEHCLQLLQTANLQGPTLARMQILRGTLRYQSGELEEARTYLQAGIREAEACQDAYLLFGYLALADVASSQGEHDHAERLLRRAERQMQWLHVSQVRYREALLLSQGRLYLHQGHVDRARQTLQRVLLRFERDQLLAPSGLYDLLPLTRLYLTQCDLAQGQVEVALTALQQQLEECSRTGHAAIVVQIQLCMAEARAGLGQTEEAFHQLQQALPGIAHQQLWQPLREVIKRQPSWQERLEPEWRQRLGCFAQDGQGSAHSESLLSKRELAVINLIAQGHSNQQIAETLFISLHTVKTHARRINVKLGVQRRTQAVARAKAEGWIS